MNADTLQLLIILAIALVVAATVGGVIVVLVIKRLTLEKATRLVGPMLQVAFFGMMATGLVLASFFLYTKLITGDNWVAVCGILFTPAMLANAIATGVASRGNHD